MGEWIDPIEYDVTELRELARVRGDRYVVDGFLWEELPDSYPPTDERAGYDRPANWTGSLDERQKPYLRTVPETEAADRVAREWVEELVDRTGSDAAVEALAYYESLGWLTESVREELEGYLLAVGYRPGGSLGDLTRADHVGSLARTARLAQLAELDTDGNPASQPGDDREDQASDGAVAERQRPAGADDGAPALEGIEASRDVEEPEDLSTSWLDAVVVNSMRLIDERPEEPIDLDEPIVSDEPDDLDEQGVSDELDDLDEPIVSDEPVLSDEPDDPDERLVSDSDAEDAGFEFGTLTE